MELHNLSGKLRFLSFILLFSNFKASEDVNIPSVNSLFRSISTTPRILDIAKSLLEIQAEVKRLHTAISTSFNQTVYQKCVDLSKELEDLRASIKNQKTTKQHAVYKTSVDLLMNYHGSLVSQIAEIRKVQEVNAGDFSLNGVVKAIKDLRFKDAENILNFFANDSYIPVIVSEIYAKSIGNVKLLLDFANFSSSIDQSLSILISLKEEAESLGHLDLCFAMDLLRMAQLDILNEPLLEKTLHRNATNLRDSLRAFLIKNSTDMMESKMISNTFTSDKAISLFLPELYKLNDMLSSKIMFGLIDRVYNKISKKDLINNIYVQCYVPQAEDALVYLYEKMRELNDLHTVAFTLAKYVNRMQKTKNSQEIKLAKRHKTFYRIWQGLPKSVKNVYSAPSVCIKNKEHSEYLYAASNGFNYDENRRSVFTWTSGGKVTQGIWKIENEFESEDYFLYNKPHREYMYVSDKTTLVSDQAQRYTPFSYVFTWIDGGDFKNEKSAFNLELHGDSLRIRKVFNKELLCVTYQEHKFGDRRFVYGINEETPLLRKQCHWNIEECV